MNLLSVLLFACTLAPDTLGTISGRVQFTNGKPAPFSNVIVLGTRRGAQSDEKGRYKITLVSPGMHRIRTLRPGSPSKTDSLEVLPGENALDIRLEPGPADVGRIFVQRAEVRETVNDRDLVAEVIPSQEHWKVYQPFSFSVRIHNRGSGSILLMMPGEWPEEGPRLTLHVSAPFDAYVPSGEVMIDGGGRVQTLGDAWPRYFVQLEPGDSFDPFQGRLPSWVSSSVPTRPGKYTVEFQYSTKGPKFGAYTRQVSEELTDRLARVPAIELVGKADFKVDY